ncbi:MAG: phosphate acyltransferase PlsX, partial [Aminobacterium colombiense]|nr:phosphate acyltransferase PlsX [Aminobacterium colombiense]
MLLALDAMGGDNAPHEPCKGAILACREFSDLEIILVGNRAQIEPIIDQAADDVRRRLSVVHTEEYISMDEHPSRSIRQKRHSSLRLAMEMARSGEAQGCVSAGNTGAIVAGGVLVVGRISGIDRPALGVAMPTLNKYTFLL